MMKMPATLLTVILLATVPSSAVAADGLLEINQTCAVKSGCFAGDTPGLPVQIVEPGSYVLTSDLILPDLPDTGGIELMTGDVTIDLNGFAIRGPHTCLPGSCDGALPFGISPPLLGTGGERTTVRNGMITGIPGLCLGLRAQAHVESMLIAHCGGSGVVVGDQSIVAKNRVTNVGQTGILATGPSAASDNVVALTGLRLVDSPNFSGVTATGGNVCDDGSCDLSEITNLLFAYVTNQAGFDTVLVISNTGEGPFGTVGSAGSCVLHYFGFTTGGGPAPLPVTTPTISPGEHAIATLSTGGTVETSGGTIVATPGFQGYIIAVCDFPLARGHALISDIGVSKLMAHTPAELVPNDRLNIAK